MKPELWVSLEDIALHLGVSQDSIHRWIRNRSMPAHQIGRLWKFKISEVDEWQTIAVKPQGIGVTSLKSIPLKKFGGGASARFDVSYSYTYSYTPIWNMRENRELRVRVGVRVRCGGAPAHSESRNMMVFQHNRL